MSKAIDDLSRTWEKYLPHAEPPCLPRVHAWLRAASVERIRHLIRGAAERPHLQNPAGWIAGCIYSRRLNG
jgi:hypothetical protein